MKHTTKGYEDKIALPVDLYSCYTFKSQETVDWQETEEAKKVLADFKQAFRNASFISQESIKVAKILVGHCCTAHNGHVFRMVATVKDVLPVGYDLKTLITPDADYDHLKVSFLGFVYQVVFEVQGRPRQATFVTREQYFAGLPEKLHKDFEQTPKMDYYFLIAQHCEELPWGRALVNPIDMPIPPHVWCVTKLLQRLSFEGADIKIPGAFGIAHKHVKADALGRTESIILRYNNVFPTLLSNQALASNTKRLG